MAKQNDNKKTVGKKNGSTPKTAKGKTSKGKGFKPPYRHQGSRDSKQDKRADEIADTAAAMSRENPISLYLKYKQFAEDAARIPFSRPLGAPYNVRFNLNAAESETQVNDGLYADTGVMRLVFSPSIGVSTRNDTPINRASINNFARIRQTQKAFGDYDHTDLTFMMLAIDSCIMYHALGRRIYGLLTDMTPVNRYYPRALVAASGVSFTSSQQMIQDFRAFLNEFALQVEQYALPKDILLFDRHQWMCEGIYVDSDSKKAQTYMFVPRGFWQYDNTSETGSQLNFLTYIKPGGPSVATNYTIQEFMAIGQQLITAMTNDADFALMSGDLYAYYGGAETFKLPYIEEKYTILPRYDRTVLSQIENATLVGDWASSYTPVISQNPDVNQGAIIFSPIVAPGTSHITTQARLNMHMDSPTPDDVIEATRLTVTISPAGSTAMVTECASEIVHYADIFQMNPSTGNPRSHHIPCTWRGIATTTEFASIVNFIGDIAFFCSYDWAPRLELFTLNQTTHSVEYAGSTWDIDNNNDIRNEYLATIHTACLYSLFNMTTK